MPPTMQATGKDSAVDNALDVLKRTVVSSMANSEVAERATDEIADADTRTESLMNHLNGLGITTMDDITGNVSRNHDEDGGGVRLEHTEELNVSNDEGGVKTKSSPTGRYQNHDGAKDASKPYSPGAYGSDFVRHGAASRDDDPFSSSPSNRSRHRRNGNELSINHTPTRRIDLDWRSGSSGSNSNDSSPARKSRFPEQYDIPARNIDEPISGQNAQAYYPATACVFVANLLQTEDEVQLEYAVTKIFSEYGPVFVKIRRDAKNMPFAFCQYTADEDATLAIQHGRGRMIHGRPCRTERAKANRTYWMSRKDHREFRHEEEGLLVAKKYGTIEEYWEGDSRTQAMMGLVDVEPGFYIKFEFYENGHNAMNAMRADSCEFKLTSHEKDFSSPSHGHTRISPRDGQCRSYLKEYAIDRDSIFVGNLPNNLTNAQISEIFARCGEIADVKLHHVASTRPGCEVNVFAFVQYKDGMAVRRAIDSMDGFMIDRQHSLRVKQKDSNYSNSARARRSGDHDRVQNSYNSPTPARLASGGVMNNTPPLQGHQYSSATFPPTPVSMSYAQWPQMSPMQLGGSPPSQAGYYPGYYQYAAYPAYPAYQYQYQYPVDYAGQVQQQYMQMGYDGYGGYGGYAYPISSAEYATATNKHGDHAAENAVVHEQGPTGTDDTEAEQ